MWYVGNGWFLESSLLGTEIQSFLFSLPKQSLLCRRAKNYNLKSSSVEVFSQSRAAMPSRVKVSTFSVCLLNEGLQLEV